MPPNYIGKMAMVFYSVNVWHKHDAWNEFGEGHSLTIPISIDISTMMIQ